MSLRARTRRVRAALRGPLAVAVERGLRMTALRAGLVLVYHEVSDGPRREPSMELTPVVEAEVFAAHLRHLRARHRIVALHGLPEAVTGRRRGQPFPVALTFDDDLRAHLDTALPLLRSAGATATFFLTGRSLTTPASFWWERLQRAIDAGLVAPDGGAQAVAAHVAALPPAQRAATSDDLLRRLGGEPPDWGLRSEHVRELALAGCEIGFHTLEHDVLTELDDARLAGALRDGREALEAAAGSKLRAIAYPHGAADARVAAAARAAGYEIAVTTDPDPVVPGADPLLLGRIYPSPASVRGLRVQLAKALWHARRRG